MQRKGHNGEWLMLGCAAGWYGAMSCRGLSCRIRVARSGGERMSGVGSGCSGRRRVSSSKLYATMHPLTARVQGLWRRARNAGAGGGSLAVRCDEGADQQQVRGGLIPAWLGTARTARNLSGPPQHCFLSLHQNKTTTRARIWIQVLVFKSSILENIKSSCAAF